MQTNLRNTKTAATVADGVLHGTFTEALIAAQNVKLPALEGAPTSQPLDDAFAKNRAIFMNDQESQLSMSFAAHKMIAPTQREFRAELRGSDEWVYDADHNDEMLSRLYTIDFDDRARRSERYEATISKRPVGRTRINVPPFDVILSALDYVVTASDDRDLSVVATETFMPRTNGVRGIVLSLTDKLYADGPKPPRHYTVKSITGEDGKPLAFFHKYDTLLISLPQPTMAASPIKLKFDMAGDILVRAAGDNQWVLGTGWFPQPSMAATATTVHGLIKVKAPFIPFAGGKQWPAKPRVITTFSKRSSISRSLTCS